MTTFIKNHRGLGAYQRDMIDCILSSHSKRGHIQSDRLSRRVATSLEARGILKIDRAYSNWLVTIQKDFLEMTGKV